MFTQKVDVEKDKICETDINYSSINGSIIFSDVTWNNSLTDRATYIVKYRQNNNGSITRIIHQWGIAQKVTFNIIVLYI